MAGFGDYQFDNCVFNLVEPLYFKAGNINLTNNTFNTVCNTQFKSDYIFYGKGYFNQPTAIMIDEAPGYKGFGEVNIGDGNVFNFSGNYINDYYQVIYNIIPNSTETAHVVLSSEITKKLTAQQFAAKRVCSFSGGNCTVYFASVEKADAFILADLEDGISIGEVILINNN